MTVKAPVRPEILQAKRVMDLFRAGDFQGALDLASEGAVKFPEFVMPLPAGKTGPTFAQLAEVCASKMPAAAPVVEPEPEPVRVEVTTLRLVHDGQNQTSLFGVEQNSPAHKIIGSAKKGGLGWAWYGAKEAFYLPKSQGYAPDMARITEAVSKLEAAEQDGQQLYRVECDIRTTAADGTALPVRMTAEQRKKWQLEYNFRHNSALWELGQGKGVCVGCGCQGLTPQTGKSVKGDDGMPLVQCYTCAGVPVPEPEAEETLDLGDLSELAALLALPSVAAPVPPSAECPSCRQQVELVIGGLKPHNRPFGGGACRGKLGVSVTDVEPEPAQGTAPKRQVHNGTRLGPKPEQDQRPAQDDAESIVGKSWRFKLEDGLSGSKRNDVATEVRRDIAGRITGRKANQGMLIEVRRDKETHELVVTVKEAPEVAVSGRNLSVMVRGVVLTVWGVARQTR